MNLYIEVCNSLHWVLTVFAPVVAPLANANTERRRAFNLVDNITSSRVRSARKFNCTYYWISMDFVLSAEW